VRGESELATFGFYLIGVIVMVLVWWWLFQSPGLFFKQRARTRLQALDAQQRAWVDKAQAHDRLVEDVVVTMRQPMQAVLQLNARVRERSDLSEQVRMYLKQANDAVAHLQTIVNDLLDPVHNRAQGDMPLLRITHMPCDVRVVVTQAFEGFALRCEQMGLTYRYQIHPDVPEQLLTDANRLTQVLNNLLGNAVKFTHEGCINLQVSADAHHVMFEVEDTGVGIASHQQAIIFERYTQAEANIFERYGGHGLGLAISRQLVTQLGGQLGVASVLGQGSRFWFSLPRNPRLNAG
jgi:two-component system sensor histidine kinase TorS